MNDKLLRMSGVSPDRKAVNHRQCNNWCCIIVIIVIIVIAIIIAIIIIIIIIITTKIIINNFNITSNIISNVSIRDTNNANITII